MLLGSLALSAGACAQPGVDADEIRDGAGLPTDLFADAGPGGGGADGGGGGCAGDTPLARLAITVTTTAAGGRYQPRNIGAIWIESGAGVFVKTVAQWGQIRARHLTAWRAASASNRVDAVTGPTLRSHMAHPVAWDLSAVDGCEVADGDYRVRFEMTDRNGAGPNLTVAFRKDQAGASVTAPDASSFHGVTLTLE
ncbi:MAG: DUF2271 domain-containing protein [Kofleriaceae bacterium]|jgi:hypothetical protein|nr:DUF2271 domain-containing protein [Kofleriaceae bacterium]